MGFISFSFECMKMIDEGAADVMALDTGLGYFAGRYHNMQPLVAEKYASGTGNVKVTTECQKWYDSLQD